MKARYTFALFCFMFQIAIAQVGIGTTSPSASLDIQSSNQSTPANTDGLLIPKIDEFPASNPGANQDGMLVYASGNGTPIKGFYFWDNTTVSWVNVKGVAVETDPKVGTLVTGYLPRWNGATLEDGAIFNSATNVGIGTLNPQRLFDVRSGTGTATPNWISGAFGPTNNGNRIVIGNLNGNATIGSHNSGINAWADLYLNSGGRVEIPHIADASHIPDSGSLEIGNALRIDDNEIITNLNSPLYFNNNNNGDVIIDNNSLMVDASANKVGIGTGTPGAIITNSKLDVVGGHVAVSNNFGVLSFNSANNSYGAGFDTTTTDDLHLYAGGANRLIVTNSGNVSAPSFSMEGIYTTGNKALITKEYADANYIDATFSGDYNDLTNLPTLFDGDYNSLTSLPTLFSGDYNDLTNQPTITNPTGLEAINEGNGIGWRLIGRNPANYGNIGLNATDLSNSNTGRGALGEESFAVGWNTLAFGIRSLASGHGSQANGNYSSVLGYGAISIGDASFSAGYFTNANSFGSIAVGANNIGVGSSNGWNLTDSIFEIGIGGIAGPRQNAVTVLKNGNIGIGTHTPANRLEVTGGNMQIDGGTLFVDASSNKVGISTNSPGAIITNSKLDVIGGHVAVSNNYGVLSFNSTNTGIGAGFDTTPSDGLDLYAGGANRVNVLPNGDFQVDNTTFRIDATNNRVGIGTSTPSTMLHIFGSNDASLANGSGIMVVGDESSLNIVFDRNEIMARDNGAASPLYLQQNGGAVYVNGAVVHASDRRLKTNIEDLNYGLAEILKLQPKTYYWKNRPQNKKSLGLIAQDVQLIINEVVTQQDSESQTLGVNYTELIPVLINATKEQQKRIEALQAEVARLKDENVTLKSQVSKVIELEQDMLKLKALILTTDNENSITKNR